MISRTNYSLDFKKKLAREMSLGENSAARISKRESISVQTLKDFETGMDLMVKQKLIPRKR
jgi:transposase-like protein